MSIMSGPGPVVDGTWEDRQEKVMQKGLSPRMDADGGRWRQMDADGRRWTQILKEEILL